MTKKEKDQLLEILYDAPPIYESNDGKLYMDAKCYIALVNKVFELCGSSVSAIIHKRIGLEDAE